MNEYLSFLKLNRRQLGDGILTQADYTIILTTKTCGFS